MRTINSIILGAVSALALTAAPALAGTNLRLATAAPQGTPWANQLDRFAAAVAEESGGDVTVEVFYNAQLGSEQDVVAQVARGRIDMGFFSNTSVALQVPESIFASMYGYFQSPEERECILDNHMVEPMRAATAARGFHFLGFGEVGPNHIVGTDEVRVPSDIAGRKIGVAISPIAAMFWETYGTIPSSVPVAESASALQTGLVEFALFPITFYVAAGINAVAPTISLVGVQQTSALMLMSDSVRQGLTDDQRGAIDRAWASAPASQLRAEIAAFEGALLQRHTDAGGTAVELTPEEFAQWQAPLADFFNAAVASLGDEGRMMADALEAGRVACSQ
ncbi:TRAP transporter substrate-binding protein DctP [Marivita sp.]|uniref:TRAP transporter substrate-binding protein n=1 Tax=Marivita sp. TaxID=2003365 RepID=UPI003219559B